MRPLTFAIVLATAMTCAAHAAAQTSDRARELFREGVGLLKKADGPDYAEAYKRFEAAYADSPSPKILGNLGLCAFKLERNGEAIDAYTRYLAEAPDISAGEREEIGAELAKLRQSTATVELTVTPPAARIRDERQRDDGHLVVNEYIVDGGTITLGLHAGKHSLTVMADELEDSRLELELGGGARESRRVELRPVPPSGAQPTDAHADEPTAYEAAQPVPSQGFWIGLGVTGAFAVATGVVGGLALAKHGEFEDARDAGDIASAEELQGSGRTLSITTDVLLGATGVAAIVTTVLLVTSLTSDEADTDVDATLTATPAFGRHGAGVVARYDWR